MDAVELSKLFNADRFAQENKRAYELFSPIMDEFPGQGFICTYDMDQDRGTLSLSVADVRLFPDYSGKVGVPYPIGRVQKVVQAQFNHGANVDIASLLYGGEGSRMAQSNSGYGLIEINDFDTGFYSLTLICPNVGKMNQDMFMVNCNAFAGHALEVQRIMSAVQIRDYEGLQVSREYPELEIDAPGVEVES